MIPEFRKKTIPQLHMARILGIHQKELSEFVRNNTWRFGITPAGVKAKAILTLPEAVSIFVNYGATAQQMYDLLDVFPDSAIRKPRGSRWDQDGLLYPQDPLPAQEHTALLALFETPERRMALRHGIMDPALSEEGVRIQGKEVWIGLNIPHVLETLEARRIHKDVAARQFETIPGAIRLKRYQYGTRLSSGYSLPTNEVLVILDEALQ